MQPWWTDPHAPDPQLRADRLVAARPDRLASEFCYDAPMYRDYFWVAMLDPVELADGHSPDADGDLPDTEIDAVAEVEHGGRPAWEAVLRPTPAYEPRCSCCALLPSREIDLAEAESGAGYDIVLDEYPDAYRVRLDTSTGVCVLTEAMGGSTPGSSHELRIEDVGTPMPDNLFHSTSAQEPQRAGWTTFRSCRKRSLHRTATTSHPAEPPHHRLAGPDCVSLAERRRTCRGLPTRRIAR